MSPASKHIHCPNYGIGSVERLSTDIGKEKKWKEERGEKQQQPKAVKGERNNFNGGVVVGGGGQHILCYPSRYLHPFISQLATKLTDRRPPPSPSLQKQNCCM